MTIKKIAILLVALLVIASIILACSLGRQPRQERQFIDMVQIPVEKLNTSIGLSLPESGNNYKLGRPILLTLINRTFYTLTFPSNLGVSLYIYDEDDNYWQMIDNLTIYSQIGARQLQPVNKESTGELTFSVFPNLKELTQAVVVRVLVRGVQPQQDADDQPVGAYIDVTLIP